MKLLGTPTPTVAVEGSIIPELPRKQITVDKIVDQAGKGIWFEGRVLFISNEEVVIVPTRVKATNLYGAASRMPRAAKVGLPKKSRKGKDKRLTKVLVEMVEYVRKGH
jgi:ribosomal protein L21